MVARDLPSFLQDGAFSWTRAGYHYPAPQDFDLLDPKNLEAGNPWIVAACVLDHAKRGDHSHVQQLKQFFLDEARSPLHRISILMVGDIGREKDLSLLVDLLKQGDEDIRIYAAMAAARAGSLWPVPHMA